MNINKVSTQDSRFVFQIGQDYFWIEIWLYNFINKFPPVQIPFFFVNQLVLEERLEKWGIGGYIVLENDYEILERGAPSYVDSSMTGGGNSSPGFSAPFLFRSDGRNRMFIKIFPYNTLGDNISEPLPQEYWEMCYDCVIYDVQDISRNEPGKKYRAYYFRDEREQMFLERNIEWSTALKAKPGAKDIDRTMYGNDALQDIISTAGTVTGDPIKIGYDQTGSIDKPNLDIDVFDSNAWAPSPTDPSAKLFYTSPGNSCVMDDINYILSRTKSADNYPVFLQLGRTQDDKTWKLIPLSVYFKLSQKNQVEHLVISDGADSSNSPPTIPRADGSKGSSVRNFMSGTASMITNYQYAPMVATDDTLLCNSPLFNYNFKDTTYNIFFKDNKITEVLNSADKMANSGLFTFKQGNGQIQLNINKTKQVGLATKNYFATENFFLKDLPKLNMLKDLIFLSGAIYFQVLGLTIRSPGRFVFIDRMGSGDSNGFDDRFLGQWMITKVTHFFSKNKYVNDVIATKIDSYGSIFPSAGSDSAY